MTRLGRDKRCTGHDVRVDEVKVVMDLSASERLQLALEMYEFGEDMMRQNLRRQHPDADAAEIERLLLDWLHSRPFAPADDPYLRPDNRFAGL
jgi:hypothetical protein